MCSFDTVATPFTCPVHCLALRVKLTYLNIQNNVFRYTKTKFIAWNHLKSSVRTMGIYLKVLEDNKNYFNIFGTICEMEISHIFAEDPRVLQPAVPSIMGAKLRIDIRSLPSHIFLRKTLESYNQQFHP